MRRSFLPFLLLFFAAAAVALSQAVPEELRYPLGEDFPRPTPAQLDSLLSLGIIPTWLEENPTFVDDLKEAAGV